MSISLPSAGSVHPADPGRPGLLRRWRWAAIPAVLAGLFLTLGLFLSGESVRLFDTNLPGGAAGSVGLWVQTLAVAVAALTGAVTTAQNYREG